MEPRFHLNQLNWSPLHTMYDRKLSAVKPHTNLFDENLYGIEKISKSTSIEK